MTSTYEQKALELDVELAEMLGYPLIDVECIRANAGVRWTQDDAEAFRLMVEYEIDIVYYHEGVAGVDTDYSDTQCGVLFKNFPDKLSAVRFAVCQAVVNKLKGN